MTSVKEMVRLLTDEEVIKDLRANVSALEARVREAEEVEKILRGCTIERKSFFNLDGKPDHVHFDDEQMGTGSDKWEHVFKVQIPMEPTDWDGKKFDSLHSALTSLTKQK